MLLIQQFIGFTQAAQDAKISLERLGEIHDRKDEEKHDDNKIREILPGNGLSLKNLVFQYEGPHSDKVLNRVCFEVPSNKITAIVGMSGSGKTTLIKLILGFYRQVEGNAYHLWHERSVNDSGFQPNYKNNLRLLWQYYSYSTEDISQLCEKSRLGFGRLKNGDGKQVHRSNKGSNL